MAKQKSTKTKEFKIKNTETLEEKDRRIFGEIFLDFVNEQKNKRLPIDKNFMEKEYKFYCQNLPFKSEYLYEFSKFYEIHKSEFTFEYCQCVNPEKKVEPSEEMRL